MIRRLQRADYPSVYELLLEFSLSTGTDHTQRNYDYEYIRQLLLRSEISGESFVAEINAEIQGTILSVCVPDLWQPRALWLREIAWYVRPNYRHTSIGARLFKEYKKAAEKRKELGQIQGFTISKLANSPDFKYEKQGFRFVESTYMIGV